MRFTTEDKRIIKCLNERMYMHFEDDWQAGRRISRPRVSKARNTAGEEHVAEAAKLVRDLRVAYSTYQVLVLDLEEEKVHATGDFPEWQVAVDAVTRLAERTRETLDTQVKQLDEMKRNGGRRPTTDQRRDELRREQRRLKWRKLSPTMRVIRGYKHEFNRY